MLELIYGTETYPLDRNFEEESFKETLSEAEKTALTKPSKLVFATFPLTSGTITVLVGAAPLALRYKKPGKVRGVAVSY